jgi:hypothetical protein
VTGRIDFRPLSSYRRVESVNLATPGAVIGVGHGQEREESQRQEFRQLLRSGARPKSALAVAIFRVFRFCRLPIPRSLRELDLRREALAQVSCLTGLLNQVSQADCSGRLDWLSGLAHCWTGLRRVLALAESIGCEWISEPLRAVLSIIGSHGDRVDYAFGRYLDLNAGDQWFPVPFLDLVTQLHEQYLERGNASALGIWLNLLNELLQTWRLHALPIRHVHE